MAYVEITKAADVSGRPGITKSATGEPQISNAEMASMVGDADAAFKGAAQLDPSKIDGDFAKSVAGMGFPLHAYQRPSGLNDTMSKLGANLAKIGVEPDVIKEITLSGIGSWTTTDGPWLYDLEAPSKKVFPVLTPVRNRIPRNKGVGTSHRYRRIDGITGSQTGGLANLDISMAENVATSFRGVSLNRPQKISYATSIANVAYKLQGISDDLTWASQFAGVGFEDLRGLINHNLLMAHMMGEEQLIFSGRITAVTAPTLAAGNVTQRPAGSGPNATSSNEAAITGQTTSIYVKVAAVTHFGFSVQSAAVTVTVGAGNVVDVTLPTLPAGAHGFAVFASTGGSDPGDASRWQCFWNDGVATGLGYTGGNIFTISGALPTSGTTSPTVDSTGNANAYDGLMTQTMANGLATTRLNSALTLDAITKKIFLPGWTQYKADVDELWLNALESIKITDLVLGASGAPFRITVPEGSTGVTGNYRVDRLVNKVTGKSVRVTVHPYQEQGNILALSYSLPFPYSEVPNVWSLILPQDYMSIQWPVIQMSYDASTFTFGALVGYAPVYNAVLNGIQPS